MKAKWLNDHVYDGNQLRSHWIFEESDLIGDAIVAFIGPADVPIAHMVDLVDVRDDAPIFSNLMLHFLIEHFDCDLNLAIARQRLLVAIAAEEISVRARSAVIRRSGNDLFDGDRKLSVSIATATPLSCCIHFAMNIDSAGTPVATRSLKDLGVDAKEIGDAIMGRYLSEIESMAIARCKVRARL